MLLYLVILIQSNNPFICINGQFTTLTIEGFDNNNNCEGPGIIHEIPIGACIGNQGGELAQLTSCDGTYYSVSYWETNSSNCNDQPKAEMIAETEVGFCFSQDDNYSFIASCS